MNQQKLFDMMLEHQKKMNASAEEHQRQVQALELEAARIRRDAAKRLADFQDELIAKGRVDVILGGIKVQ